MKKRGGILKNADKIWNKLEDKSASCMDIKILLENLYEIMMKNLRRHPLQWSDQNWRFTQETNIASQNLSTEKRLEKAIVQLAERGDKRWANQVPAASGLINKAANKASRIDLVYYCKEGEYNFIELKTNNGTNTPIYAAVEVVYYGLLYLLHRSCQCYMQRFRNDDRKKLLTANKIHLKVLAPKSYYQHHHQQKTDLKKLKEYEKCLSKAVSSIAKTKKIKMDFSFEEFKYDTNIQKLAHSIHSNNEQKPLSLT
jgi:hypothetical protein